MKPTWEKISLHGIRAPDVPKVWNMAVPFLEESLKAGQPSDTLLDIYLQLIQRDAQLWAFISKDKILGFSVTQVGYDLADRKDICWILEFGGRNLLQHAHEILKQFIPWAVAHDCTAIRLRGRKGWKKIFPDWEQGVDSIGFYLEKEL